MTPRRKRGRPALSLSEPTAAVNLKLTASMYDRAYLLASEHRISVPEVIRRALADYYTRRPVELRNLKSANHSI